LAAQLVDARVELAFDGQVFNDGFDDDVAGADRGREIVLQVPGGDQRLEARREEGGRLGLARPLEAGRSGPRPCPGPY
jgi:hypothetical protein